MLKLMSVELLKVRRSLALLMMFGIPLIVVLFNALMLLKQTGIDGIGARHWSQYWMGNTALWGYFMLPLYIALVTGLLNGQEHKNQTWRLMLTLPVSQTRLFIVKLLLAWLFVAGATSILLAGGALCTWLMVAAGADPAGAFEYALLPVLAKLSFACLPVLVIQHAISWRFQNLVLPLATGVIGTMGIVQVGSSSYWVYYPWTYALMSVNGSMAPMQQQALLLAAGVGAALFLASAALLGRREIEI